MKIILRGSGIMLAVFVLSACAIDPLKTSSAFVIHTDPTGAAVETTTGFRCITPCHVPTGASGLVATVTLIGYKPVQIPFAQGQKPGTVSVKLQPQDPGAGAPSPAVRK